MTRPYQQCTRCIMDTSDPEIAFGPDGSCSHCRRAEQVLAQSWLRGDAGRSALDGLFREIREAGRLRPYDCVLGLSGGVDSSYLAHVLHEYGMRPLVVHVDAGWNSEVAVRNIENIVKKLGWDLYTEVIDWEEVRDLQLAFLKASLANQDVPQDHAYFAALYRLATRHGIRHVISGGNLASESILPPAWGYNAMDGRLLRAVHRRFGSRPLKRYPVLGFLRYGMLYPWVHRMRVLRPLNYLDYDKREAMALLQSRYGWVDYGGKHFESRFTKFFQAHYLPVKFGFDKRRAHYSSLIVSGQMTRDEALSRMREPLYPPGDLEKDRAFVAKKLGISDGELQALITQAPRTYRDYPSNAWLFDFGRDLRARLRGARLA